jgi:hypothetical protein
MTDLLSPALILVAGAILTALLRGNLRVAAILGAPLVTLWAIWQVPDGVSASITFLEYYQLQPVEGSSLRRLFATIFAIMAFAGGLYAFRQAKWYELAAAQAYAAGAVGVCFAGDLITLFLYWELMALFSTVIVWCGGTPAARRAGIRYAIMHLLGGVILKVGIEGIVVHTGSIEIQPMLATNFDTWMVLIGILINAAAPPVSAWLADSYPESSPTGSVFLSAFTTKTAVLALILLFPGEPVLIWVGLYMVMYGIIYALLENDARRILAYSIVNQVGFMVCGVGIGTAMALNGAAAHRRGIGHFRVSADLGLYDQDPDLAGSHRRKPRGRLFPSRRSLGRRLPACRHQVSVVRVFPERFRVAAQGRTLEYGRGHGAVLGPVHPDRCLSAVLLRVSPVPRRLPGLRTRQGAFLSAATAVLGPCILPVAAADETDTDHQPRHRLVVACARFQPRQQDL